MSDPVRVVIRVDDALVAEAEIGNGVLGVMANWRPPMARPRWIPSFAWRALVRLGDLVRAAQYRGGTGDRVRLDEYLRGEPEVHLVWGAADGESSRWPPKVGGSRHLRAGERLTIAVSRWPEG